jgi:hypothetical protein
MMLSVHGHTRAQSPSGDRPASGKQAASTGRRSVPLSRFVPANAGVFVSINRPRDVDDAMNRTRAWQLLSLLSGKSLENMPATSLRSALGNFIGTTKTIRLRDVMESELGLIGSSWTQLGDTAWLVRPDDPATLDGWFPSMAKSSAGIVTTPSGLIASVRHGCALMNRSGGSVFGRSLVLLAGRKASTLHDDATYRNLIGFLPARPLATAYLRTADDRGLGLLGFPDSMNRVAIGLYEGKGRIDFSIRGALAAGRSRTALDEATVGRLFTLPETTLLATVFTPSISVEDMASQSNLLAGLQQVIGVLRGMRGAGGDEDPLSSLGQQMILVWDHDFRPARSSPQLALLMRCGNPGGIRSAFDEIFENSRKLLSVVDTASVESLPTISRSSHLGIPISSVSLARYAAESQFSIASLFSAVEPSWTILDGWLIVSLSRDHLERIIDASRGLIPKLSDVEDVQELARQNKKRTSLTVLQADLAAAVINGWLADVAAGKPSLLDEQYWAMHTGKRRKPQRLGIGMSTEQGPGYVSVARVYPNTVADGSLQVGDTILGIDGELLDLAAPNSDLRRRWLKNPKRATSRIFRVDREGEVMEIEVSSGIIDHEVTLGPVRPAAALRELASLASSVQFTSFSTYVSEHDRYAAQASLRLVSRR